MAKYWEHLQYHEDDITKRFITEEELTFLQELQKEMNTQDTCGEAEPRYWVIRDYERFYGESLSNPDGLLFVDVSDDRETLLDFSYHSSVGFKEIVNCLLDRFSDLDPEEFDFVYDLDSLRETLKDLDFERVELLEYSRIPVHSGFFLTQKAAEKHLRENDYHYAEDAHTYAMTAWRSTEAEMLYQILHEVDFSALKGENK